MYQAVRGIEKMAAPHSPLPSIATPATKPPSTYTRRSNDTDRQLVGDTPVRTSPVKDEAKVRIDDMRERGVEVAGARRYPGKTKWGLLLIFSVSQVRSKSSWRHMIACAGSGRGSRRSELTIVHGHCESCISGSVHQRYLQGSRDRLRNVYLDFGA